MGSKGGPVRPTIVSNVSSLALDKTSRLYTAHLAHDPAQECLYGHLRLSAAFAQRQAYRNIMLRIRRLPCRSG